jgi:hypothetical protein
VQKDRVVQMMKTVTKHGNTEVREALSKYVDIDPDKFPVLGNFLVHEDFADITKIFGPQTLREAIEHTEPAVFRMLQRFNVISKGAVLSFSGFHMVALVQSIVAATAAPFTFFRSGLGKVPGFRNVAKWLGERTDNPVQAAKFMGLWGEAGGLVEYGVRNGLQLATFERIAQEGFQSFARGVEQAVRQAERDSPGAKQVSGKGPGGFFKALRSPLTGALNFNRMLMTGTWEIVHNSGKSFVFAENLNKLMKKFPEAPMELLAKQAAASANAQMGGLNWRRMYGNAGVRQVLQLGLLAPDWTLSNLIVARDFLVGFVPDVIRKGPGGRFNVAFADLVNTDMAASLARKYWLNAFLAIFGTKQLVNYAINGHTTFENPGGDLRGKLEIYLGREDERNGKPVFLHTGKQFGEPFELVWDGTARLVPRKASPIARTFAGIFHQRDSFMQPITTPEDSPGIGVLKNFGWAAGQFVPIPASNLGRAVRNALEGKGSPEEFANVVLGSLDFPIRRHHTEKEKKGDDLLSRDLPSYLDLRYVPDLNAVFLLGNP